MESAFGASYGLFLDIKAFGSALSEANRERITKKGLLLAPFNTYFQLMNQLAED